MIGAFSFGDRRPGLPGSNGSLSSAVSIRSRVVLVGGEASQTVR
jgi:hypothetical protein